MSPMPDALQNSLSKLIQGPVEIVVDPSGADEVTLYSEGGAEITPERNTEVVETDIVGVFDLRSTGDGATFELTLPERSIEVLNVLFRDYRDGSAETNKYRAFGRSAGSSSRTNAKQFRIRPYQTRSAITDQVVLWLCAPEGNPVMRQSKTEPHAFTQTFRAFPDLTKADGDLIGRFYGPARSA